MEKLRAKAEEKRRAHEELESRRAALDRSLKMILASVVKINIMDKGIRSGHQLWSACGIVGRANRRDTPGIKDGMVLVTTRTALPNAFTANHALVTFYDSETLNPTLSSVPLDSPS